MNRKLNFKSMPTQINMMLGIYNFENEVPNFALSRSKAILKEFH